MPGHRILTGNKRYTRHRRRRRLIVRAIKCICIPPADGRGLIRRKAWQLLQRDEFNRGVNRTFPLTVFARGRSCWSVAASSMKARRNARWKMARANDCVFRRRSACLESRGSGESPRPFLQPLTAQDEEVQKSSFSLFIFHPSTFYFLRIARKSSRSCLILANFFLVFYFFLLCNNKLAL